MEFEEQEEELCMGGGGAPGYDPIGNPTRVKMPEPMMVAQPMRSSSNNNNNNSSSNNNMNMMVKARYRECLKNHAVGIGGHALDGCGEFMAAGTEGTLDALKCAACNCHRNFHRKETESTGEPYLLTHHPYPHHPHLQQHHHQPPPFSAYYRSPAGYLHVGGQQRGPLALPSTSGAGAGGGRDTEQEVSNPSGGDGGGGSSSRKRFRTKFTQEQKDKMLELAERVGWRIQKQDESLVQEFCNESGVKRQVLKVWMHNNKHTLGKKP